MSNEDAVQHDEITFENGNKFVGDAIRGMPQGKGVMHFPNGHKYEGEFKAGQKHGQGKYYINEEEHFDGVFVDDVR